MADQKVKKCTKCGETKPFVHFHADLTRSDGRHPHCSKCRAVISKKYEVTHKAERREWTAQWRERNPDRTKAISVASHDRNKNKRNAYSAEYRANNLDRMRELSRAWARNNPEKMSIAKATRRSAKINATPAWADAEFEKFYLLNVYEVATSRSKCTGIKWHVDHIIPLKSKKVCGLHCSANMQVIPITDNLSKGNRVWPDMP